MPTVRKATQIQALPKAAVVGLRKHPFMLLFSGKWRFNSRVGQWQPRMTCPQVQIGLHTDGEDRSQLGTVMEAAALKTRGVRALKAGDKSLGSYANFLLEYPVKIVTGSKAKIVSHFALANETYHTDRLGRIIRKVDPLWLEGLFKRVLKAGIVLPPVGADLRREMARVEGMVARIDERMTVRGAPRDELETRRAVLVKLLTSMETAFREQFPDADKTDEDLEPVSFGDEHQGNDDDSDDDAL
jgi:hypothetical protein